MNNYIKILFIMLSMAFSTIPVNAGINQIYCNPVEGSTMYGGGSYSCVSPYFTYDYTGSMTVSNPNGYYPMTKTLSSGATHFDLLTIGANLTWDKSEYTKSDMAHLTISFNAANFNNTKYLYQVLLVNPVTFETGVYTITSATMSINHELIDEGVWESTIWVSDRSDIDQAIYYVHDYKTVEGTSTISFLNWQYHASDLGALGSDGKFTYGVSTSSLDYVSTFIIKMYKNGVLVNTWDDVPNFGTMYYPLTSAGKYEVKLIRSTAYVETVLKTDINIVSAPQSFIQASKAVYNTTESVVISGNKYPESTEKNFYYVIISHYQSISSIDQRKEISYPPYSFSEQYTLPVGRYTATLYGYASVCGVEGDSVCMREKDYVTFDVVEPMVGNQHALNISWVKTEEKLWTVAWVNYQNTTSNDIVKVFDNAGKEFKNWRTATYPYTLGVQLPQEPSYIGNWSAKIYNASNLNDFKVSYLNVVSASQQNFTNDFGIIMNFDTPIGTPGMHELTWNTGTYSGSYYIKLVNGVTGVYLQQFPYTTGTAKAQHQSIYLDKDIKIYTAQFISGNSTILSSANIEIGDNAIINPTLPGSGNKNIPTIEGASPAANSLMDFISSTIAYGIIIWIAIIIGFARIGIEGTPLIAVVWLSGVFVALAGLFDPYKIYVIILSTIISAVLFKASRDATIG